MTAFTIAEVDCSTGVTTERAATDEEVAARDVAIEDYETVDGFNHVRSQRDHDLKVSDWTTNSSDSPLSDEKKAEWVTYRQALRDYPDQAARVSDLPDWPTAPDAYIPTGEE